MKRILLIASALLALGLLVTPAAAISDSRADWTVQYFNNCCLVDPPTVTQQVERIDFNWGAGSPAAGINPDFFSARFNATVYFAPGTYRFSLLADDVARLSINLEPIISTLESGQTSEVRTVDRYLDGFYNLQVDYQERTGDAFLRIGWENLSTQPQPVGGTTATVLVTTLNVRSAPSLEGDILTRIGRGQTYGVLARSGDGAWVQINAGGIVGWVSAALVRLSDQQAQPTPQPSAPTEFSVTALANLRLRTGPFISNNTLTTIPAGSSARVLARDAGTNWLKVDFNGQIGWVSIRFVRVDPPLRIDAVPVATS